MCSTDQIALYASLYKKYQDYLDSKVFSAEMGDELHEVSLQDLSSSSLSVGIIGGGMAGLYSALLLQKHLPNSQVTIFEASGRVGGRVYTHKFSTEPHQYFDAGAMRVPKMASHSPVFTLIDYLNDMFPETQLKVVNFPYSCPEGNRVFVNRTKQKDGRIMSAEYAGKHCSELGFSKEADVKDGENAGRLLSEALAQLADALQADFETALLKYSSMTVREFMSKELGWSRQKIDYVETMSTITNYFETGLISLYFDSLLHNNNEEVTWKTIKGGMSKLPELCAEAIKKNGGHVFLNAKVESIVQQEKTQHVTLGYSQPFSEVHMHKTFDRVIITIPPPYIRFLSKRPYFGEEHALRSSRFLPTSKMGLRFHSRFWERTNLSIPPSIGGSSLTDLPSRLVLYPCDDTKEGKGVLVIFNHSDDTHQWNLMSEVEQIKQALHDLQLLYPEVNIAREYAGGESPDSAAFLAEAFSMYWPYGAMMYHPGQFMPNFLSMVKPRGNIFFAGSHLSVTGVWIMSALGSARRAVQQLTRKYYGSNNVLVDFL